MVNAVTPVTPKLTISGRVIDKKTGDPLVGVTITNNESEKSYTDLNGCFEIIIKKDDQYLSIITSNIGNFYFVKQMVLKKV